MNATGNLKATAAICVSIVQEVTTVSAQMDSKCLKTTRLVNVRKVSRSPITGQCAWVSSILFSPEIFLINFSNSGYKTNTMVNAKSGILPEFRMKNVFLSI